MKVVRFFGVASLCLGVFSGGYAFAETRAIELERIVVTPARYAQKKIKTPSSVSIITQQDIKASNAQTVPDILRTQAGLVVRDYYGSGIKVSVDLRGFGETAGSNTLVLVDGRRVNEIDLSGVDWSQIPLDRVERIEIARGAHSVLYGDNAVGGVINIITKTGEGKPRLEIEPAGGSYDMNKQKVSLSGAGEELSYFLAISRHSTQGYRKNSNYEANEFSAKLNYKPSDYLSLGISGGYNDSDFGLPGALLESDLAVMSRRDSRFPDDKVKQSDWYTHLSLEVKPGSDFQINTHLSFRSKKVDNNLRSSSAIWKSNIDTLGFTPSFKLEKEIAGRETILTGGIDFYRSEAETDDYSFQGYDYDTWLPTTFYEGRNRQTNIDKKTTGYYLHSEAFLLEPLSLSAGYRYERAKYSFDSRPLPGPWTSEDNWDSTAVDKRLTVNEKALNVGLNYGYSDFSRLFMRFSKGYRFPATDEYYSLWSSPPVNTGLRPQRFRSYETGLIHEFNPNITISLTLFNMDIKNELYYDPLNFENRNYDKTRHRGVESELKWKPLKQLSFLTNYTYNKAYFRGGAYSGNQVPLAPYHKVAFSSVWQINEGWQINTVLNYIGKRYFISDQSHDYPKMDDYVTVDLKASYRFGDNRIFAGINNIFDKKYSEYGVISLMAGQRAYYPSPGRNFIAGCSFKF